MNKLKKFLIVTASFFIGLYLLFMILVYAFGNLNSYVPQIQSIVKEMAGLDLNLKSAKLTPTPKVEIKLTIEDLAVSYPDSNKIASVDKVSVKVPVLPVIAGNIKLSEIIIEKPQANFVLSKKGEIDLVKYLEPYMEKMQGEESSTESSQNNGLPKYFRISTKCLI